MKVKNNDFTPASLPPDGVKIDQGVFRSENAKGQPVLWILFNADPARDAAWEADGFKNAYSKSAWRREQLIDFQAGGGELVLRETLERRWKEIIITDPKEIPWAEMNFGAGLDYGKTHFGTWVVNGIDRKGVKYSVLEHGATNLTPNSHVEMMKTRRLPYSDNGVQPLALAKVGRTHFDPSLKTAKLSAQSDTFVSEIDLFVKAGMPSLTLGIRGRDLKIVDLILDAWNQTPVKYRIFCPTQVASRQNTHSGWQGCPNLVWELMNLRRKEYSATVEQSKGTPEDLVDKDNDFWDANKYEWSGNTPVSTQSPAEAWSNEAKRLKEVNPALDLNSLVIYARKFERENKVVPKTWR